MIAIRTLAWCLAVVLGACAGDGIPDPSASDINVMVVLPFTGRFSSRAEAHQAAIQMAFRDLEAAGELIPGRRVRLWPVDATDDKTVAAERVAAALAPFQTDSGYDLAGILSSTEAAHEGSLALALDGAIPHFEVASGSMDDEIVDPDQHDTSFAFQTRALCHPEAMMSADFLAMRWTSVLLVRGDKAHDEMHTGVIRAQLAAMSAAGDWAGTVLNAEDVELVYPETSSADYWRTQVAQLVQTYPNTEVLYFHFRGDQVNFDFLKALELEEFPAQVVTCGMARKPELLDPVNPGVADFLLQRFWFVNRGPVKGDLYDRFNADLRAFRNVADMWAANAYDSAILLGLGVAGAGAVDGLRIRDGILEASRGGQETAYGDAGQALDLIRQGMDVDYTGAAGPMDIRDDRTVLGRYYVEEIRSADGSYGFAEVSPPDPQLL